MSARVFHDFSLRFCHRASPCQPEFSVLRIVSNGRISDEDLCLHRALYRSPLISPIKAKAKFITRSEPCAQIALDSAAFLPDRPFAHDQAVSVYRPDDHVLARDAVAAQDDRHVWWSRAVRKSIRVCTLGTKSFLGNDAAVLAPSSIATPSSMRRVDGVEVDAAIQHERAVKF